jgi:uncharacterized membrane protein YdbT with pleckstrin-like domain
MRILHAMGLLSAMIATAGTNGPGGELDAEGRAWVLLAVLALVIVALATLIIVTLIRYVSRRSQARLEKERRASQGSPAESAWSAAGKRAAPIDTSELESSDDD